MGNGVTRWKMSLKPFWNEQCEALVHALDAGGALRVALPRQNRTVATTQTVARLQTPARRKGAPSRLSNACATRTKT